MSKRFILTDDLDETTEAVQTIYYTIDGQEYEIDLSEENIQRFHAALEPFVSKSREVERQTAPVRRSRGDGRRRSSASGRNDLPQIREWANDNGYNVSERGRIKKEIIDAYDQAHS